MRVITSIGLCEEVGRQTYAANSKTHFKIQRGSIGAEKHQSVPFCFFCTYVMLLLSLSSSPRTHTLLPQSIDRFCDFIEP